MTTPFQSSFLITVPWFKSNLGIRWDNSNTCCAPKTWIETLHYFLQSSKTSFFGWSIRNKKEKKKKPPIKAVKSVYKTDKIITATIDWAIYTIKVHKSPDDNSPLCTKKSKHLFQQIKKKNENISNVCT